MKIKVMTFNTRVPVENDGINYFPNRKERILACIAEEKPDLIGFQEATGEVRAFLRDALSEEYTVLGCGREAGFRGESTPIAYRKDLFDLVNLRSIFLSDTPSIPGSRYENSDQSKCPRMFIHAELTARELEGTFHFVNTHLDHRGREARLLGMKQILSYKEGLSGILILTGDMNATPDEECIVYAKANGLKDTAEDVTHTFHGFGLFPEGNRIDYILTDASVIESHRVEDAPVDGVYASDHYAVVADLEI